MRKYPGIIIGVLCVIIFLTNATCIKSYDAGVNVPAKGYLVVEGFINSDGGPTTIYLSRTQSNYDTAKIVFERKAIITIQGENNTSFPLPEITAGTYKSAPIVLNKNTRYRVHIKTSAGQQYNSDYSNVRSTPAFDSVFYSRDNDKAVTFLVNTHDPKNNTRYYLWKWDETWEYHSPYQSNLKFVIGGGGKISKTLWFDSAFHSINNDLFVCYHNDSSTNIAIGSSEKLTQDVIQDGLIGLTIPPGNEKLSVLFSLYVKQYAISKDAYLFYQQMQKNSEQLGSIFDAQPSQVTGNIHNVSDSTEKVIGFVEVSQEIGKRIWIHNSELPQWGYDNRCLVTDTLGNDSTSLNFVINVSHTSFNGYITSFLPTTPLDQAGFDMRGLPLLVIVADPTCVDCTLKGGFSKKPSFWP